MELKKYTTTSGLKSCGIHWCPKWHFHSGFFIFRSLLSYHQAIHASKHSLSRSFSPFLAPYSPFFLKQLSCALLLSPVLLSPLGGFHLLTPPPVDSYRPLKATTQKHRIHVWIKEWKQHTLNPEGTQNLIGDAKYVYTACNLALWRGKTPWCGFFTNFHTIKYPHHSQVTNMTEPRDGRRCT